MVMTILASLIFNLQARAQSEGCEKKYIDQCRDKMTKTIGEADQATQNISPGLSQRDAATAQQSAFTVMQRGWEEVVKQCSKIQETCKGSCAPSGQCKSQIDKVISFADTKATESGASANSAMGIASQQDDAEAAQERETASVQKAGASNLDTIRNLQRNGPCTQSGAGNETICQDSNGNRVYVPSGPGDAFKPFKGL